MEYQNRFLNTQVYKEHATELARLGLKSIMFAGEGEPFLHKDIVEMINHTKASGIDVAITTNGVLFGEKLFTETLRSISWTKVSINAATPKTYAAIHRTDEKDFGRVIENITKAVKYRNEQKIDSTIGMQMILLPENRHEAVELATIARDIGADYLVIKSYSQHLKSITTQYKDFSYDMEMGLKEELDKISTENFSVVFRANAMSKLSAEKKNKGRGYARCLALPFWSYIDAGGGVWGCSAYLSDERFLFGNINENSFEEIWTGEKRRKCMEFVDSELDVTECRTNCRMDEVNRYLSELKNPASHVNFI
jgi:radical SAM protein with 4Fe4S-binding SPASM domain